MLITVLVCNRDNLLLPDRSHAPTTPKAESRAGSVSADQHFCVIIPTTANCGCHKGPCLQVSREVQQAGFQERRLLQVTQQLVTLKIQAASSTQVATFAEALAEAIDDGNFTVSLSLHPLFIESLSKACMLHGRKTCLQTFKNLCVYT